MKSIFESCCDENDRPHRGRPRCSERNKSMLKAATHLFMERGFDGTSMDAVAKEAGVSKQTVYSHFSSKDELFSAAITNKMEDYFPDHEQFHTDDLPMEVELRQVAFRFTELLMSEDAMSVFRLLVSEAPKGPHLAQIFWQAGPKIMLGKLSDFLGKWVKRGELKIDDLEVAGMLMINLLKGHTHFVLSIGLIDKISEEEMNACVDDAVEKFLKIYQA